MAYRTVLSAARGDPGLLGTIRSVGRVALGAARFIPGVGTAATIAGTILGGGRIAPRPTVPALSFAGPGARPGAPRPGIGAAVQRFLPGGRTGRFASRRMNAGNAKAARRAIRRIKAVRHLLQSIERELPRRPAARSSGGVITRSEAARALRR